MWLRLGLLRTSSPCCNGQVCMYYAGNTGAPEWGYLAGRRGVMFLTWRVGDTLCGEVGQQKTWPRTDGWFELGWSWSRGLPPSPSFADRADGATEPLNISLMENWIWRGCLGCGFWFHSHHPQMVDLSLSPPGFLATEGSRWGPSFSSEVSLSLCPGPEKSKPSPVTQPDSLSHRCWTISIPVTQQTCCSDLLIGNLKCNVKYKATAVVSELWDTLGKQAY